MIPLTLLERLRSAFGVRDTAMSWFASYLSGRTQQVSIDGTLSMKFDLECGVSQGSCLGPLLFVAYATIVDESLWDSQNPTSVAKSSAVFLQIHVPFPLYTQYNVERSKELCLDGFNTVCGVGGGGRDVQC